MRPGTAGRPLRTALAAAAAAALFAAFAADDARAHERDFTLSRDWRLPAQHEHELESFTFWDPRPNDLVQELEVDYGITSHASFEPGVRWTKPNADRLELSNVDADLLFSFRSFGYDKLLPAFGLGYDYRLHDDTEPISANFDNPKNALDFTGILSWYTERGEDYTANLNVGRHWGDSVHEWDSSFTAGYVHPLDFVPGIELSPLHPMNVGLEFSQEISQEKFTGLGPVLSWRGNKHFKAVGTFVYAVNKRSEHFDELRLLLEWEF
jgi:hypothetical protein